MHCDTFLCLRVHVTESGYRLLNMIFVWHSVFAFIRRNIKHLLNGAWQCSCRGKRLAAFAPSLPKTNEIIGLNCFSAIIIIIVFILCALNLR